MGLGVGGEKERKKEAGIFQNSWLHQLHKSKGQNSSQYKGGNDPRTQTGYPGHPHKHL